MVRIDSSMITATHCTAQIECSNVRMFVHRNIRLTRFTFLNSLTKNFIAATIFVRLEWNFIRYLSLVNEFLSSSSFSLEKCFVISSG